MHGNQYIRAHPHIIKDAGERIDDIIMDAPVAMSCLWENIPPPPLNPGKVSVGHVIAQEILPHKQTSLLLGIFNKDERTPQKPNHNQ